MAFEKHSVVKEMTRYIRKLNHVVQLGASKFSQQYGLTESQSRLLRALFDFGEMSSAKLSRKLYVTPANVTGIIDRLEKKELVQRVIKQKDRRIAFISLTPKGIELVEHMPDPLEEKLSSGFKSLDQGDALQIKESMESVIQMLDSDPGGDASTGVPPPG